ncbi:MAG: hypothetical protein P8L82_06355 [Paracoccaceae bacterium]|nr:hypothetical protein [Paracoccaceae bacterium]
MAYHYKIEPVPEVSKKFLNSKSISIRSAEMMQRVIEMESKSGWEFFDVKDVKIPIKKTFLKSAMESTVSFLVFRKLRNSGHLNMSTNDDNVSQTEKENIPNLGPALKS